MPGLPAQPSDPRRIINFPFEGEIIVTGIHEYEDRYLGGKPLTEGGTVVGPKYGPGIAGGTNPDDRSALVVVAVRFPNDHLHDPIEVAVVDLRCGEMVMGNWANGADSTARYTAAAIILADAQIAIEHG